MDGSNCTFSCNPGYELQGPQNGTCLPNHTWSGEKPSCEPKNCPNRILLNDGEHILNESLCQLHYRAQCRLFCNEGHKGDDVIYVCTVTSNPAVIDWVPIGGIHASCERGRFVL